MFSEVPFAVSRPRKPNELAHVLPTSAVANPKLARALQNDGFKPAEIDVGDHVQRRHINVIFQPRSVWSKRNPSARSLLQTQNAFIYG